MDAMMDITMMPVNMLSVVKIHVRPNKVEKLSLTLNSD